MIRALYPTFSVSVFHKANLLVPDGALTLFNSKAPQATSILVIGDHSTQTLDDGFQNINEYFQGLERKKYNKIMFISSE